MRCQWCEEELRRGEEIYELPDGTVLCEDCLREWAAGYKTIYEGVEASERFRI